MNSRLNINVKVRRWALTRCRSIPLTNMIKFIQHSVLTFLLGAIIGLAHGQTVLEDSIRQVIATAEDPMVRSEGWLTLAGKYQKTNVDSALWATRNAIDLIKKLPISEHKANLLRYYGYLKCINQELDTALVYLTAAEEHAREQDYKALMGVVLMDKATYMNYSGEIQKAIYYLKQARTYIEVYKPEELFTCINETGAYYYFAGKQDSAFLLFKEAAKVARKESNAFNLSGIQMNLAIMYDLNGYPDSALIYYKLAIKSGELSGQDLRIGEAHMNLGTFYQERNHIKGSIQQFQKAISHLNKTRNKHALFMAFENIVLAYTSIDKSQTAFKYLLLSDELLKENHFRDGPSMHYKGLAAYYETINEPDSTLKYTLLSGNAFLALERPCEASQQYTYYITQASSLGLPYDSILEQVQNLDRDCSGQVRYDNLQQMGKVYLKEGKLDMAEALTDEALSFMRQSNYTKNTMTALETKSLIYKERGEFENAYKMVTEINELKDSILNIDREQEVNYLELQFQESKNEMLQKQAEANDLLIASQQSSIDQKNRLNIALIIVAFLVLAVLSLLIYFRLKDRKLYSELSHRNQLVSEQNETILANNEALEENNRQKDNLMSIVAHDLGSPLRGIKGICDMMLDFNEVEGDIKRNVELMKQSAENGITLTTELLEANQFLDTKNRPKTRFKVSELAKRVITLNQQAAKRKHIVLHQRIEKNLVLNTSKESLNRTLDNLLSNAIKFSKSNTNVWFTARTTNTQVEISVKDEGQGFSEKDLERVFQPFQKLSARPTNNEGSTGLGLSIVKKLVEEIDGTIALESKKGKGATFTIKLPLESLSKR